jgi:hypothetical protein
MTFVQDPEEWHHLAPLFIMGMQRSGTSIMARALTLAGFPSFGEGHLWFELIEPFARFRDPDYCPNLKRDVFALGKGRNLLLEKYIALAIDQFHRDNLPGNPTRWADKSPGVYPVKVAPMLARVFPTAQFIFMYRSGISTVNSGLRLWPDRPNIFWTMCNGWAGTMSTWRQNREHLDGRFIEIRQEEMAGDPEGTAAALVEFLGVPACQSDVAGLFRSRRVNTAFPDRPPGDYRYEVDWSDKQKALFVKTCGPEMARWGYAIPFSPNLEPPGRWEKARRLLRDGGPKALWAEAKRYLAWRLARWASESDGTS